MKLGVNVDHIATLREARKISYPDPVMGALLCEYAGCDSIVAHLREDRRHIKERDIYLIKKAVNIPFNLEMSINKRIVSIALDLSPSQVTLVPERREELTTEGGIDLVKLEKRVGGVVEKFHKKGIRVSLFIDPVKRQINIAKKLDVENIEINTGRYSEAKTPSSLKKELGKIKIAAGYAKEKRFMVAAGHGLNYDNVVDIVKIKEIEELNIGHSIIARSVFVGIVDAVEEMLNIIKGKKKK